MPSGYRQVHLRQAGSSQSGMKLSSQSISRETSGPSTSTASAQPPLPSPVSIGMNVRLNSLDSIACLRFSAREPGGGVNSTTREPSR